MLITVKVLNALKSHLNVIKTTLKMREVTLYYYIYIVLSDPLEKAKVISMNVVFRAGKASLNLLTNSKPSLQC